MARVLLAALLVLFPSVGLSAQAGVVFGQVTDAPDDAGRDTPPGDDDGQAETPTAEESPAPSEPRP